MTVRSEQKPTFQVIRDMMFKTLLCSLGFLVQASYLVYAQPDTRVARVGLLSTSPMSAVAGRVGAFRQGLKEIGYVEGKNIAIDFRSTDGKLNLANELAAELVRLKVDVIVTSGGTSTRPAKEATSTIPIVMAQDVDPVASGFVASLARPGGNITGLSTLSPELNGKQLELLKEIVPKLSRVAVFGYSSGPPNAQALKETDAAARALSLHVQHVDVLAPKEIEPAFQAARSGRAEAVLVLSSPITFSHRKELVERANKSRFATIYWAPEFVEAGGLLTYSVSFTDLFRRAAYYVDKILKGAKPADLPVEQPTKFELVINLKTAKQIGLTIPPNVLARADKVIK
jgi:putative tryptophan/tyrosine transport system substrate-binding protein